MTTLLTDMHPAPRPAACLVGTFGYRVEGDTARLNAEVDWRPEAAEQSHWRLQLWASALDAPSAPALVAELPVSVPLHTHGEPTYVEGYVMALPPAGGAPQAMSLRLVAQDAGGSLWLHDEARFAQPEHFVQPRLQGVAWSPVAAQGLALVVDRVRNPRPEDNLSGSLQLELWALDQPCRGGPFSGRCIASLALGALPGQAETGPLAMPVAATEADAQRPWCLMLREWTALGYVTRDCAEVAAPHGLAAPPAAGKADAAEPPAAEPADALALPLTAPALPLTALAALLPPGAAPRPATGRPVPPQRAQPPRFAARVMANLRQLLQG